MNRRKSAIDWRRSPFCANGACVEVAQHNGVYLVRDSKRPAGPVLEFTGSEWDSFVAGVKAGTFKFD